MVIHVDQISTPPTPADSPPVFEERAAQVWSDLARNVPQMNQQADEIEAIGQAADAAMRSAQADSDAAMGFRNEAGAARDASQSHASAAAQSAGDAVGSSGIAAGHATDSGRSAERAETAASRAESVVANAVQMTSATGAALLPEGPDAKRPAVGSIPAGSFIIRGSAQDAGDYRPEFWNRQSASWQTLSSREWTMGYVNPFSIRISALEAAPKPIAPGSAPQFVCRAWANFSGTTIRASGNISSITKSSTGIFVANLITPVSDVNCAAICIGSRDSAARLSTSAEMISTTQCRMAFHQVGTGDADPANASLIIVR